MKKVLTITAFAGATTFGLFTFMAFLVNNDKIAPVDAVPTPIVEFAQIPDEKSVIKIVRFENNPPPAPKPMPRTFETPTETSVDGDFDYGSPVIKIASAGPSLTMGGGSRDSEARPVVRINPKYPIAAARDGIEGWVKLRFDINAIGGVTNIEVIDAEPKRVFNKAARQALRKWKYRAKSEDGKTMVQQGLTVQLDFNMNQQSST
jgi:protein TonB